MFNTKIFLKAFFLPAAFLVVSCSTDDSPSNYDNSIREQLEQTGDTPVGEGVIGNWKAVKYIYDGQLYTITDVCQQEILQIKTDGTAISTKQCEGGNVVTDYTWTNNGNDIYGFDSEETYFPVTYFLTFPEGENKMFLKYTEHQSHEFIKIYTRI